MEIILLRHGEAEQYANIDSNRALTAQGRSDVTRILQNKKNQLQGIDCLLHSPYLRAVQTAEIVTESLSLSSSIVKESEALTPEANPRKFIQYLSGLNCKKILIVTHQPFVGILLDTLCDFEAGRYRLGTSALAALTASTVACGCADLLWLEQPEY